MLRTLPFRERIPSLGFFLVDIILIIATILSLYPYISKVEK